MASGGHHSITASGIPTGSSGAANAEVSSVIARAASASAAHRRASMPAVALQGSLSGLLAGANSPPGTMGGAGTIRSPSSPSTGALPARVATVQQDVAQGPMSPLSGVRLPTAAPLPPGLPPAAAAAAAAAAPGVKGPRRHSLHVQLTGAEMPDNMTPPFSSPPTIWDAGGKPPSFSPPPPTGAAQQVPAPAAVSAPSVPPPPSGMPSPPMRTKSQPQTGPASSGAIHAAVAQTNSRERAMHQLASALAVVQEWTAALSESAAGGPETATVPVAQLLSVKKMLEGALHGVGRRASVAAHGFSPSMDSAVRDEIREKSSAYDERVHDFLVTQYTPASTTNSESSMHRLTSLQRLRRAAKSVSKFPTLQGTLSISAKLRGLLDTMSRWDFNVLAVSELVPYHVLSVVGFRLFEEHSLTTRFHIEEEALSNFLKSIEEGYLPNPYHCAMHGADVTQTVHYFITAGNMSSFMDDVHILAALTAAMAHDVGHPAVNNPFLVATRHPLAVTYNDKSPLENMHAATCIHALQGKNSNILSGLEPLEVQEVRKTIINMILATDNATHAEHLGHLKTVVSDLTARSVSPLPREHLPLVLNIALHAADVSNPAKTWTLYEEWTNRITQEFFAQGDQELARGLPVTPMLDRRRPIPRAKFQAGFINAIVLPLFHTFSEVPGVTIGECVDQLEANLGSWNEQILVAAREAAAAPGEAPKPAGAGH